MIGANFGAFFVGKFVAQKEIFRAESTLQMCHLNIVKTSGFTRGVCQIDDATKFKSFLVEFQENKRS